MKPKLRWPRRTAVWFAIWREANRRHRLGLASRSIDAIEVAEQITAAAMTEALWLVEPKELASQIIDQPFDVNRSDELFQLQHEITMRELAKDPQDEMAEIDRLFRPRPMNGRFKANEWAV